MFQGNRGNCILIIVIIISQGCWQKLYLYFFLIRCNKMVYSELIEKPFPIHNMLSLQYSRQTHRKDKMQNVNLRIARFYSLLKLGWIL